MLYIMDGCKIIQWSVLLVMFYFGRGIADDDYDRVEMMMERITDNADCKNNSKSSLFLPQNSVTHIPNLNNAESKIWRNKNRTALVHLHNMAFNRAIFYSYALLKHNATQDFFFQPDWAYLAMSVTADIHANAGIMNASAIYFDNYSHYPNWLTTVYFNQTIPLFGPKAYYTDFTNNTRSGVVTDMGSGADKNYTTDAYKMNPWYNLYLPDVALTFGSVYQKDVYSLHIKYASGTGVFQTSDFVTYNFYGPAFSREKPPVMFTRPYFDCKTTNKWVVSAVSPIVDYLPRYTFWMHIRRPRFVGVVVMDIDFHNIDINPCEASLGNPQPSSFAGIDKCVSNTTTCSPTSGRGFQRGGYTCECKDGYHYPDSVQGPFKGSDIEKAPVNERESNFQCLPIYNTTHLYHYNQTTNQTNIIQKRSVDSSQSDIADDTVSRTKRDSHDSHFNQSKYDDINDVFRKINSINKDNCAGMDKSGLVLPVEYSSGVHEQFENQARVALRLAHFLSNYHQNFIPDQTYGDFKAGNRIHFDHIFGEVAANVISDINILSSGVFYEQNSFENRDGSKREYFGPYAYSQDGKYYVLDTAGYQTRYTNENWYETISSRWRNDTSGLHKFKMESFIRSDKEGTNTIKHPDSPIKYYAPSLEHGHWSQPRFKCDGQIDDWVITYSVPFFGKSLKFSGVVTVDVPLKKLDINQCPQPTDVSNPFKNTAICDYESTFCIPVEGKMFQSGGYKCNCRQGYEYPWTEGNNGYDGELMEREYDLFVAGDSSNVFDKLKCRKIEVPTPPVSLPLPSTTTKPVSSAIGILSAPLLITFLTVFIQIVRCAI